MRPRHYIACALAALGCALACAPAALAGGPIVDRQISFHVRNVDRSALSCFANGADVTLVGRLVAPASALADPSAAVTLYLHEFSFGKWFWHFPDPGYDYATLMAQEGHVSVLVDRLGYDESTRPRGQDTCVGADADEAHQMVVQLRAGSYELDGLPPRPFGHVVLAGHSGGAMASEIEAYSFGGIDGLITFAHADQGFSLRGLLEGVQQGVTCLLGGQPADPGGPPGYAYFGATPAAWRQDYFAGAEQRIVDAAVPLRNRDPCGDVFSFPTGAFVNLRNLGRVTVPVLLLYGLGDALYTQPNAGRNQSRLFSGSRDVTLAFFPGSGHALTLQRTAPDVRRTVSDWLDARGLR